MAEFSYFDETNWKYTNSGTADLLSSSGTTLTNLPESQSKTGSAFYQTARAKCFDIPATPEIWIRFDVFTTLSNRWRAYNGSSNGSTGICSQADGQVEFWVNSTRVQTFASAIKNQLQTVILHMVTGSSSGIVEVWLDGEKIYTYTGNVNNGENFADIYLQSDGSGTFFSNVLISNIQSPPISRLVNFKPAIFVTALIDLPTAEIDINPELFAVVATKPPTAEIDFLPEIYVTIKEDAPTAEVDVLPELWAVLRPLAHPESTAADTLIRAGLTQTARGDMLRKITFTPAVETASGDTNLILALSQNISADTLRKIQCTEIARADTCRALREVATADTLRIISCRDSARADTLIRYPHDLVFTASVNSFKDYDVTNFSVSLNERTLSDNFTVETARALNIGDAVKGMLLDYHFSFLAEETSQQGLIQTIRGMYDIDKLLYTHIDSSGTISYRNGDTEEITAAITTGYIAYKKDEGATVFCAKATDILIRTAVYLGLTPNIKIQNFTPYNLSGNTNITYSDLISTLFSWTSRLPQRQINVFIRGGTLHVIQRGLESSTFDISDLPHSRPMVDKKLLRTMYNNPFRSSKINQKDDDDPTEPSGEWTEEEIVTPFSGTISFGANGSYTSILYSKGLLRSETSQMNNSKANSYSKTSYNYIEVFPESTTELSIWLHKLTGDFYPASKSTESTTIQFDDDEPKKIETRARTEYTYSSTSSDNIYLTEEYEYVEKYEYEHGTKTVYDYENMQNRAVGFWKLVDSDSSVRQTFHTPVGSSWYATSLYVDGEPQGSTLSQGKPGNKVSLYTINEVQKTFTRATITPDADDSGNSGGNSGNGNDDSYEDRRRRLSPIADTSFPVRELNLIRELTRELYWLNRKTQETVTVDILDEIKNGVPTIGHIVDFTERVILNGAEYFLVSNQISFTPRSLIQKLQLVRWY